MSPPGIYDRLVVMSHTITLDTLEYANQLKSVGVPDKQAEKFATLEKKRTDEICSFIDNSLATKHDIELIRKDITWIMVGGGILGAIIIAGFTILGLLITHHN